jgi:hypothetical protein
MPAIDDGVCPDLFMRAISSPTSNVWYNRKHKVGIDASSKWLKCMLKLVGIDDGLISNKSGRVSLITRMAASGVPDEVGMLVSGHHTQSGYSRYDRTEKLKMEAAIHVSCNPGVSFQQAMQVCSKNFLEEEIAGSSDKLVPLLPSAESQSPGVSTLSPTRVLGDKKNTALFSVDENNQVIILIFEYILILIILHE